MAVNQKKMFVVENSVNPLSAEYFSSSLNITNLLNWHVLIIHTFVVRIKHILSCIFDRFQFFLMGF